MAFVCATFLIVRIESAKASVGEFIRVKKEKIIFCVPGYVYKEMVNKDHEPADRNNQSNCQHQPGVSGIVNNERNKRNKIHNC